MNNIHTFIVDRQQFEFVLKNNAIPPQHEFELVLKNNTIPPH